MLLEGEKDGLIMLPSDKALLDDPNTRALVELYAKVTLSSNLYFLQIWTVYSFSSIERPYSFFLPSRMFVSCFF